MGNAAGGGGEPAHVAVPQAVGGVIPHGTSPAVWPRGLCTAHCDPPSPPPVTDPFHSGQEPVCHPEDTTLSFCKSLLGRGLPQCPPTRSGLKRAWCPPAISPAVLWDP